MMRINLFFGEKACSNGVDPNQTAHSNKVWSGLALFAKEAV